jgi:hypothetical protein
MTILFDSLIASGHAISPGHASFIQLVSSFALLAGIFRLLILILLVFLELFLHWVDTFLEDAAVEELASDVDIRILDALGESELGVCGGQTNHGLEGTHGDRH